MEAARSTLAEEERKAAARAGLGAACESRDKEHLRTAIFEGEQAGLEVIELKPAQTVLSEEERKTCSRNAKAGIE